MSFSSKVKNEILADFPKKQHCRIAEIFALINICGHIAVNYGNISIKVQTENIMVAQRFYLLIKNTFGIISETALKKGTQNNLYSIVINNSAYAQKILSEIGMLSEYDGKKYIADYIEPSVIEKVCCKKSYIKAAFLAGGSISAPEKTYHMEFVNSSYRHSIEFQNMVNYFEADAKVVERKGHYIVYVKDSERITDLLSAMGAIDSVMELENLRIIKDMRNKVNRIVNCETANLNKTISASVKQIEDINYIQQTIGIQKLPELLQEIAQIRLMYPEASLKELGEMLSPKVGKSGVNHRLKKITEIAERLKQN